MNVICPKCGKENTVPFSDSVFKQTGFECEDCKSDFGVDDGIILHNHIQLLNYFYFTHTLKTGVTENITIQKEDNKVVLKLEKVENKILQPYESVDFTNDFENFKSLLFEKLFILDWNKTNIGLKVDSDESFKIILKYEKEYEDYIISGINKLPPYFKILDMIFSTLFTE